MKKTFALTHPKKAVPRVVDAVKFEVKKYIKRERNKTLPAGADFWSFDCRFGDTEQEANVIHLKEINKSIDAVVAKGLTSFYLEILAKPSVRQKNIEADDEE
ncbi:hypothetical protein ABT56_03615 [Photobacterium aquae]|uniref:Uncharacterized protein n=1 Tax=Photobacterium aquae TaxID=1195763 RepID=A0A0J1HCB0_9GAMM|nr:DUF6172 family protein [Photobacterium aquae]KLV09288.1 hypothetical protein ABT56_03615 [Photobacterium aquae]